MGKSFFDLERDIALIVNQSEGVALQSSKINEKVEKYILHTLKLILEKYGRGDLLDTVYTITKELTINGVKANQKRIFFEDNNLDLLNESEYERGMTAFKQEFRDPQMNEVYGKKARERDISVKIFISHSPDGMKIEIENNSTITPIEEKRLREKMKKGMGYNDIAEFYMDNMDNAEGAGLGIALILIMLKSENIDPGLFRIFTLSDRTVARVEFPFTENYHSSRELAAAQT
ncbi:MAG: histidine kinase [Spirochaetales bacterium]|nr:histidine kinase [Spirochaetales bacterium]